MKKKILFILPNLNQGGAQKVLLTVLNHLDTTVFEPSLIVIQNTGVFQGLIPKHVSCRILDCSRVRYSIFKLLNLIRSEKPDVIVSTLGYLNIILCMLKVFFPKKTALVIREGSVVSELLRNRELPSYCGPLYRYVYNLADAIVCQSKYMLEDLAQNFGASRKSLTLIYNPVDLEFIREKIRNSESPFGQYTGPNIVAMGRMAREKNFDKIIEAFEVFCSEVTTAQLWLIGSGALTENLMNMSRELGIGDRVHFLGFQKNPYIWLKHADLFVMCSEYEGLPNVLLEALACGCPVIAMDCPGGTREIMKLTGNLDRLLSPGKFVISKEMFERKAYEPMRKSLEDNFGLDSVMTGYKKVLLKTGN